MTALTNPKAAWALQEPAPMGVILRRAEAARATASNVDRLLGATPVDVKSRWIAKIGVKKEAAETTLKDVSGDADYAPAAPNAKPLRVVQAEAWAKILSDLCPHESKFPSLVAQVNGELGTAYTDIASTGRTVARLKADKAAEEAALEDKDMAEADKAAHEKKKNDIQDQIDKTEADYRPKVDAFLGKVKDAAAAATAEAKKQTPTALVAFKRAIDDAKLANSVALVRFPLAMPTMPQELKTQAKKLVADVVEEKTGHRPNLEKFDPDVKLEGGSVKLTLNGLPPEAMASLKPDALLAEVTKRSKDYVVKVLTLPAYVDQTQELLDLQSKTIAAMMDGFAVDETKVEGAGDDLVELKVETDVAAASKVKGPRPKRPVPVAACGLRLDGDKPNDKGKGPKAQAAVAGAPGKVAVAP
jgi:hypothetical protein